MDQIKIGRFIAKCRKEKDLTQAKLAEKLSITDRAVSKWERGKSMPDSSIMLELCQILDITVEELLSGERLDMENNDKKKDELLLSMTKKIEEKNKTIWTSMCIIMIVCIVALLLSMACAAFLIPEGVWQLVVILGSVVLFLIPCFYALKLEVSVGAYKCKNCGNEFVPTYREALMAMHCGTTRHLKCPKCGERTWCKKVINKE